MYCKNKKCQSNAQRVSNWLRVGNATPSTALIFKLIFEELEELARSLGEQQYKEFKVELEDFYSLVESNVNKGIADKFYYNKEEAKDAIADVEVVLHNFTYSLDLADEYQQHFDKVMESNESKYCSNEDDAIESVRLYKEGNHPDKKGEVIEADYKKEDNLFVVFRKSDNKILKSYKYSKV